MEGSNSQIASRETKEVRILVVVNIRKNAEIRARKHPFIHFAETQTRTNWYIRKVIVTKASSSNMTVIQSIGI